ncbi:MAG: hypothetical protein LBP92_13205 [Deltaproteobacteria bacterium]|jgi:hypothetical protein|nr:hypothetical protein [Deltaproteobacteria bacterium]
MIDIYKQSGKTKKLAFIIIPIVSLFNFIILIIPYSFILCIINYKYSLSSIFSFLVSIIIGLIFCFSTSWANKVSHCRNCKIASILCLIGFSLAYYLFICTFIVIGSTYNNGNKFNFIDLILVFKFLNIYISKLIDYDLGKLFLLRLCICYIIIIFLIILFFPYNTKLPYSEKDHEWLQLYNIKKIISTNLDLKAIKKLILNKKIMYLFNKQIDNKGNNDIDCEIYINKSKSIIIMSLYYLENGSIFKNRHIIFNSIILNEREVNLIIYKYKQYFK